MKEQHHARRTFTIGLFVTVVGGLIVEVIKGFPLLRWTVAIVEGTARWLGTPVPVPRWSVVLFWMLLAALVWLGVNRLRREAGPAWLRYREDDFLEFRWRWGYFGQSIAEGTITPYCPHCMCQMIFTAASAYTSVPHTQILCQECGYNRTFDGIAMELRQRVGRLIERSIRTGAWEQAVTKERDA